MCAPIGCDWERLGVIELVYIQRAAWTRQRYGKSSLMTNDIFSPLQRFSLTRHVVVTLAVADKSYALVIRLPSL